MKKFLVIILILILILSITACGKEAPFEKGTSLSKIYIATDTHLLSEELFSEGNQTYIKENLTADGRIQEKDYELMEALVTKVNEEKPDAFILTGDLSFNGERKSHEALISFLDRIEKDIKVLVIPGNHDFNIEGTRAYYDDTPHAAATVEGDEFCELYKDYGYTGAISYDENSYSYIYEINDKLWALMLDSTLCAYNEEAGLNTVGGVIWEETIEWLRPYLEEAKNKGIQVIGFSHHNLAEHNPMFNNNYVMFDADKLAALYEEYNIRLHFSGHMHIQNIAKTGNIYDIAQGSLLDYGNKVGILEVFDNCMEYTREQIGDFEEYSLGVFSNKYLSRNTSAYEKKYGEDAEEVHFLASVINAYYFDGNYIKVRELLDQRSKAGTLLKKNEKDSYFGTILNVEKVDQNYLLIK